MVTMVEFDNLPEGCIANVLSFTTPRDATALSLVSSAFRSASQSDVVWDRFLPSDYLSIISQSQSLTSLPLDSKKDLFLHLCHKPLLIDAGKKSFALEKRYGKKCYMLSARALSIVWADTPRYWRWISLPDARFDEVAELVCVCWLEIKGWINTSMLSPETLYGAYLVYKPNVAGSYGFENQPVEVSVGISGEEEAFAPRNRTVYLDVPTLRRQRYQHVVLRNRRFRFRPLVSFDPDPPAPPPPMPPSPPPMDDPGRVGGGEYPKERGDGWWEIELGEFFNGGCEDRDVEMGVYEVKGGNWKGGLVLQGIEIRPKPPKQIN